MQLALTLNADVLKGVSFFSNLATPIVAALVLCLRSRIYMPLEVVITQGEVSQCLFFIRSGKCQVVTFTTGVVDKTLGSDDSRRSRRSRRGSSMAQEMTTRVLAELSEYSCFGEQSFLLQSVTNASVRSLGYANLMRLFRNDFEVIVQMFPALRVHMLQRQIKLHEDRHRLVLRERPAKLLLAVDELS